MAVRIRLKRVGNRNSPAFRVVVAEHASPRDGRFLETIGHYNAVREPALLEINEERAVHWLQHGAQPSEAALALLRQAGIWQKFKGTSRGEGETEAGSPADAA